MEGKLIETLITQAPAVVALLYLVHRQEALIREFLEACIGRMTNDDDGARGS